MMRPEKLSVNGLIILLTYPCPVSVFSDRANTANASGGPLIPAPSRCASHCSVTVVSHAGAMPVSVLTED